LCGEPLRSGPNRNPSTSRLLTCQGSPSCLRALPTDALIEFVVRFGLLQRMVFDLPKKVAVPRCRNPNGGVPDTRMTAPGRERAIGLRETGRGETNSVAKTRTMEMAELWEIITSRTSAIGGLAVIPIAVLRDG